MPAALAVRHGKVQRSFDIEVAARPARRGVSAAQQMHGLGQSYRGRRVACRYLVDWPIRLHPVDGSDEKRHGAGLAFVRDHNHVAEVAWPVACNCDACAVVSRGEGEPVVGVFAGVGAPIDSYCVVGVERCGEDCSAVGIEPVDSGAEAVAVVCFWRGVDRIVEAIVIPIVWVDGLVDASNLV